MPSYAYTQSRIFQWIGILLALGIIATGYYYFRASAGVKTNVSITDDPLALGLAGYWKLDDGSGTTATDSSARGNNGTLNSGPTWTTGQIEGALNFDGADDNVTTAKTMANSGTVSVWVNSTATINSSASYYALYATASGNTFFLSFNGFSSDNRWDFSYRGNFGTTVRIVGPTLTSNSQVQGWHLLTATWDVSSGAALYVDGQRVSSTSTTTLSFASMSFGLSTNSLARWAGKLDDVRMYDRILTADEVSDLYRLTSPTGTDTSLKGYWSFNGPDMNGTTAYDRSGAGNNGTLTNGPTVIGGRSGQALSFNGSNQYISVPDQSAFSPAVNDLTISVWARVPTNATPSGTGTCGNSGRNIFGKGNGTVWEYVLENDSNNLLCFVLYQSDGSSYGGITKTMTVNDGEWHHYVMAVDYGVLFSVYIDGALIGSRTSFTGSMSDTAASFRIGDRGDGNYFSGQIDEVRVYNRALSAAEIQAQYKAGQADEVNTGASQPQGGSRLDSGLAGYWKMDDGSGTSATDSSTNGNTGTLTNGPTWTTGQIGGAVDFDGTDDYINLGAIHNFTSSDFTISQWLKFDALTTETGGQGPVIIYKGAYQSAGYYAQVSNTGRLSFVTNQSGAAQSSSTADSSIGTGTWYNFVFARKGSSVRIYINGNDRTETAATHINPTSSGSNLMIGTYTIGNNIEMNGQMDEVRVYNRSLSADEVAQLYRLTSPTGVDTGLKGYWSFNGKDISGTTAYDRSGAGNNGTLTNGPTVTPGKVGQALRFDGTNDYVRVKDGAILSGSTNATISAWIKTSISAVSGGKAIYAERASSGNDIFKLTVLESGVADNTATFVLRDDAGTLNRKTGSIVINDNIWHHIVAVKNGTSLLLYVDGVADGSPGTQTGTNTYTNANLKSDIGQDASAQPGNFNGSIDEVRIYNRALSAAEIQSLYKQGQSDEVNTGASQPQGTGRLDSGLAGYWKLDDASGTSATDSSTNGNTGTLTNGPTWTTGQIGGGVSFDNSNDYISVGDPSNGSLDPSLVTVTAWFKLNVVGNGLSDTSYIDELVSKDLDCCTDLGGYSLMSYGYGQPSKVRGLIRRNSNGALLSAMGATSLVVDTWYHGAMVFDGTKVTVYLNGVQDGVSSTISSDTIKGSALPLFIGSVSSGGPAYVTNGSIDEVRIYNRALSSDEVSQLYRLTSPTGVDTSLKGYWSFNGPDMNGTTAYDRSGAGNNGTLTNGPTVTPGKLGQALSFDGTDDYVTTGDVSALRPSTVTVCAWAQRTAATTNEGIVSTWASNAGYLLWNDDSGNFSFPIGIAPHLSSGVALTVGVWFHLCGTFDGTTARTYVNGVFKTQQADTLTYPANQQFNIGRYANVDTTEFTGAIDEVRVYNRALSAAEIQSLYSAGK